MSGRSGKKKMSKLSRSARAGVIFPVGRLMRYLKKGTFKYRISVGAPVYMAAVIEYLAGKAAPHGPAQPAVGMVAVIWPVQPRPRGGPRKDLWSTSRCISLLGVRVLYSFCKGVPTPAYSWCVPTVPQHQYAALTRSDQLLWAHRYFHICLF